MHPLLLKVGPFSFYSYGFMISMAFVAAIALSYFLAKKVQIDPDRVFDFGLFILIGSIIGARLFYVVLYWNELHSPAEIFMVWNGGLVFYGGLVFAILSVLLAAKIYNIKSLDILDVATPATALGYAIGRIGCFLNGCCYGSECSLPWAVRFPEVLGLRHPTQIYSSISGLIIMGILLIIFYRRSFPGQIFSSGIVLYGIYRFIIEYFRTNAQVFYGLTAAQLFSGFLVVLGIGLYGIFYNRNRSQ